MRATSQLLTRSLEHLGEPVGMSLQEPWLLAAMLRPVERGHGAWSPQPPATASLHGAAGACPLLTSGHHAWAPLLPLGSGTPSDPAGPSKSNPRPFQGGDCIQIWFIKERTHGLLQRREQPALPDNGVLQRRAPGQEGPLGWQLGHRGAAHLHGHLW